MKMRTKKISDIGEFKAHIRTILPKKYNSGPVRTNYKLIFSSNLGGDLFGYHWLDGVKNGLLAIYIVDIYGHGLEASLLSLSVVDIIRNEQLSEVDFSNPAQVLKGLNAAFPLERNKGMLIAAWYGVYDVKNRQLVFASAGHPPAIMLDPSEPLQLLGPCDLILGVKPQVQYHNTEVNVSLNSRLWLCSDGAYEVHSLEDEELGLNGLARLIAEVSGIESPMDSILKQIEVFHGSREFEDDLCLVEILFAS